MPSRTETRLFAGDYQRVFAAMIESARLENVTVEWADPNSGVVRLSSGMSLASWGETLHVQMGVPQPGEVAVAITSSLKFGLVDWGRNRKNIDRLFARLQALLP